MLRGRLLDHAQVTTGEIARAMNTSANQATLYLRPDRISDWHFVPGSTFRRASRLNLMQFMEQNKYPLRLIIKAGPAKILVFSESNTLPMQLSETFDCETLKVQRIVDGFAFGFELYNRAPIQAMVFDLRRENPMLSGMLCIAAEQQYSLSPRFILCTIRRPKHSPEVSLGSKLNFHSPVRLEEFLKKRLFVRQY